LSLFKIVGISINFGEEGLAVDGDVVELVGVVVVVVVDVIGFVVCIFVT